jgi:hypothetical protein|tara:strand:+ start:1497 stop:1751 length:255 start_codon:yes stop_codon:yes gene_type:complete
MSDKIFKKTMHAWFSQKQYNVIRGFRNQKKKHGGYSYIYRSCETGENIEVTEVSRTAKYSSNWDDVKYLGEVDKWVKTNYHYNL